MRWIHTIGTIATILLLSVSPGRAQDSIFWPHLLVPPSFVATNVTSGLVNYWKFDANSGTTAVDSADSADGNLLGAPVSPSWVPGQINSALLFFEKPSGAQGTYLQLTNNCAIGSGAFSVTWWFFRSATNLVQGGGYILEDTDNDVSLGLRINCDAININLRVVGASGDCVREANNAGSAFTSNQWYHVVITFAGNNTVATGIHIYTNLVECGNYDLTQNGSGSHGQNTTQQRTLGSRALGNGFDGIVDDFRIYNRVIDAGERTNLFFWRGP